MRHRGVSGSRHTEAWNPQPSSLGEPVRWPHPGHCQATPSQVCPRNGAAPGPHTLRCGRRGHGRWHSGRIPAHHFTEEEVDAWRKGSCPEVGREPVEGAGAQLRPPAPSEARGLCPGGPGAPGAGVYACYPRVPGIGRPWHRCLWWKLTGLAGSRGAGVAIVPVALAPAPSPEDPGGPGACSLLSGPGASPFPAAEEGPGSLGRAACSVVGLPGPLCAETEAPFTGATGPAPVEKEHRPLRKGARELGSKKKINLSFSSGGSRGPWGESGARPAEAFVGGSLPGEGPGWVREAPSTVAQGSGLSLAAPLVSHPAAAAAATPPSPSSPPPAGAACARWPCRARCSLSWPSGRAAALEGP